MADPAPISASRSERRKARTITAIMDAEPTPEGPALEQLLELAGRMARFGRERPGHLRMLVLPQPREAEEALREPLGRVRKRLAAEDRRTAGLIWGAGGRGDARPRAPPRAA